MKCFKCKSSNVVIEGEFEFHDIIECQECETRTLSVVRIDSCCRNPYQIVTIDRQAENKISIYKQCIYCGGADRWEKLKHKDFSDIIRDEFSLSNFDKWTEKRNKEKKWLFGITKNANYLNSKYYKYISYLSSPEWKDKRELVFKRDNNICQLCKSKSADQVHHLIYDNLYNEPLEDLISVCYDCHFAYHNNIS